MSKSEDIEILSFLLEGFSTFQEKELDVHISMLFKKVDDGGYNPAVQNLVQQSWIDVSEVVQYGDDRFKTLEEITSSTLWLATLLKRFFALYEGKIDYGELNDNGYRYVLSYELFHKAFPEWKPSESIKRDVEELLDACADKKVPAEIVGLYISLLRQGEQDGALWEALKRVSRLVLFDDSSMRREVNKIMS